MISSCLSNICARTLVPMTAPPKNQQDVVLILSALQHSLGYLPILASFSLTADCFGLGVVPLTGLYRLRYTACNNQILQIHCQMVGTVMPCQNLCSHLLLKYYHKVKYRRVNVWSCLNVRDSHLAFFFFFLLYHLKQHPNC